MRPLTIAIFTFACSGLMAQSFTSPPGMLNQEGSDAAFVFGSYADLHYQQVDRDIRSHGPVILNRIGHRLNHQVHTAYTAAGRKFTNCKISLAEADLDTMSSNFARNRLSAPTVVFSASLAWPSMLGPTTKPAPWPQTLSFPFGSGGTASTYFYLASSDLLIEAEFAGGSLNNQAPWGGATERYLSLDGQNQPTHALFRGTAHRFIGANEGDCADSSRPARAAASYLTISMYSAEYTGHSSIVDKSYARFVTNGLGPGAPVVQAVSLRGSTPGTPLAGFHCYNLMIDTTQVVSYLGSNANYGGLWASTILLGATSRLAALGTISIWTQGAFEDSVTGLPKLTAAANCVPNFGLLRPATRKILYSPLPSSAGIGPSVLNNPVVRYN